VAQPQDQMQSTRVDLAQRWARHGGHNAVVGADPYPQMGAPMSLGIDDEAVARVLEGLEREHTALLADRDLLQDPGMTDQVRSAIRAVAQKIVAPREIERLVRKVEGHLFSLGDLAEFLADPEVLEIQMIGPDFAMSRRRTGGLIEDRRVRFRPGTDPVMELKHFAEFYKTRLDTTSPYATFMAGPWRVSIHIPPHVTKPFTLTMRRSLDDEHKLDAADFLRLGSIDRPTLDFLYSLVDAYQTMLTFAPQRSGKTQLQRVLIDHMNPLDGNIVLLEDIPEIRPNIPVMNFYQVRRDSNPITMLTLAEWVLRESAVRVVLGEFRQKEAAAFIDLTQQGTAGLTTGHGSNCVQITNRLVDAYQMAMPGTSDVNAFRKVHEAIGFYIQMRRYVDRATRTESFRVYGVYEVLPTDGHVSMKNYRPLVQYRFRGFDPVTHAAVGVHEVVNHMTEERYADCLERSNFAADIPARLRPPGERGAGLVVSVPEGVPAPEPDPEGVAGADGPELLIDEEDDGEGRGEG